jgi:hypothetical protein
MEGEPVYWAQPGSALARENPMGIVEDGVCCASTYPIVGLTVPCSWLYLWDLSSRERRGWEGESTPVLPLLDSESIGK